MVINYKKITSIQNFQLQKTCYFSRLGSIFLVLLIVIFLCGCSEIPVDYSKIEKATKDQITWINSGLLPEDNCSKFDTAFINKLEGKKGMLLGAKLTCPGVNSIAIWYTSSKEGSSMILSVNGTARGFSIYPRHDGLLVETFSDQINLSNYIRMQQ